MTTKYGIISDIHAAHLGLVKAAIDILKQEGAEKLVLNGDLVGDRNPIPELDEKNYAALVLQLAGESGLETYALEGSHECVPLFKPVIDVLSQKYGNIIDVMENPKVEGEGYDLVFLAGSDWHAENAVQGGYHLLSGDNETGVYDSSNGVNIVRNMNDLKKLATRPQETVVFSHVPRKFDNIETSVDMAYFTQHITTETISPGILKEREIRQKFGEDLPFSAVEEYAARELIRFKRENRGNDDLANLYQELGIKKNVTGHFHESAHRAHDSNTVPVKEGELTNELFWNASYLDDGKVGLLTVDGPKVSYRNINLKDFLQ